MHSPLRGDKVDYGIGLSYRPASLSSLTGRYENPIAIGNLTPPQSETMNWASGLSRERSEYAEFTILPFKTARFVSGGECFSILIKKYHVLHG
jgi:hypothetical protein